LGKAELFRAADYVADLMKGMIESEGSGQLSKQTTTIMRKQERLVVVVVVVVVRCLIYFYPLQPYSLIGGQHQHSEMIHAGSGFSPSFAACYHLVCSSLDDLVTCGYFEGNVEVV
jgi:hypothetical protein